VLLDYGLATRIGAESDGGKRLPFRGTPRYCSIAVHEGRARGPRDDMWALLYVLVECIMGSLPWKGR
jgi:serine/threonine protein kinase